MILVYVIKSTFIHQNYTYIFNSFCNKSNIKPELENCKIILYGFSNS